MKTQVPSPVFRSASAAAIALALACAAAQGATPPRFPPTAVWHTNIANASLHPQSAAMLGVLAGLGGWGNGNRFQIDFSIHVSH